MRHFLVVRWLRLQAPKAGAPGSIPGWGIRSHMPQLRFTWETKRSCVPLRTGAAKLKKMYRFQQWEVLWEIWNTDKSEKPLFPGSYCSLPVSVIRLQMRVAPADFKCCPETHWFFGWYHDGWFLMILSLPDFLNVGSHFPNLCSQAF